MPEARPGATTRVTVFEVSAGRLQKAEDTLAAEEPLELRLVSGGRLYPVAVTMRTPGADFELASGFMFNEGILASREQLRSLSYCVDAGLGEEQRFNVVNVEVGGLARSGTAHLERHFSMTSACGVCGKATIEALRCRGYAQVPEGPAFSAAVIESLPAKLRRGQRLFEVTGGLHAAGLFSPGGELLAVREDVGRHNAMDKLVGWALLEGRLPLTGHIAMVSGRSSFELVQKSLSAGVAVLCSVSAPSSLAVSLAREFGLTLIGFLREGRFKVYAGESRVKL